MIYLVDFGTCYKIGQTFDLKNRLRTFKNSREYVKCINLIIDPEKPINQKERELEIETELHNRCAQYKITREMFQKDSKVILEFEKYKEELGDNTDYTSIIEGVLAPAKKTSRAKQVFQYSLDGLYLGEYSSMADAERAHDIYSGKIRESVKGRQLTVGGFFWSDHKLTEEEISERVGRIKKSKSSRLSKNTSLNQYSLDGEFIRSWKTMTEAAKELGTSVTGISLCCSGKCKTAKGYIWKIE